MKHLIVALSLGLWLVALCGCGGTKAPDQDAADFLGAETVYVLSAPEQAWGWNFQRADGSIATDPPIRLLDPSVGRELGQVLLAGGTYKTPARGGTFERSVGFRLVRGGQTIEAYPSFANDQLLMRYVSPAGQTTQTTAGIGAARDRLLKVVARAFSDYRSPK
jgi:hypothetical protein